LTRLIDQPQAMLREAEGELEKATNHLEARKAQIKVAEVLRDKVALANAKARLDDVQKEVTELTAEVEELRAQLEERQEVFKNATKDREDKFKAFKKGFLAKATTEQDLIKSAMSNLSRQAKEYATLVSKAKWRRVPLVCALPRKGLFAADQCCCVIGGVAMKVPKTFTHWEMCKGPVPWRKTRWSMGCTDFTKCDPCGALIHTVYTFAGGLAGLSKLSVSSKPAQGGEVAP